MWCSYQPLHKEEEGSDNIAIVYPHCPDVPGRGGWRIEVISINLAFMLSAQVLYFAAHL